MQYSIGEIAEITGLPVSTLRYYDRVGLFPAIHRSDSGARIFTERELERIEQIEALKTVGFSIQEIKQYMLWQEDGDETLQKRRDLFYGRLQAVKAQVEALEEARTIIESHCRYYDEAIALRREGRETMNHENEQD